jgi:nicotinate phosphoribosyltransferase
MCSASVLLTDLYELTMLQAYHAERMDGVAVFELFVRKLPPRRNFLVVAGLAELVDYLLALRFTEDDLDHLRRRHGFDGTFLDTLRDLRFTGDVDAIAEGTPCFPDEPLVRVTAPIREAQLVESRLMNLVHFETVVASKAVRCALAAPGRLLVDFGMRRSHGAEAALLSARASYLAGFSGTATVEAGRAFDVPVYGTMAHSYVQAHHDERTAFLAFARAQPRNAVLLIDTYDTERGARVAADVAHALAHEGIVVKGVRIDSGDLADHARRVRAILDAAGLPRLTIFASGNLDEMRVQEIEAQRAPIDGYGIGTRMNTSADAPYLDCAYKLQEYDGEPKRKRSEGKATWPGRKQVYRRRDPQGRGLMDVVTLAGDPVADGVPLLEPVIRGGRLARPQPGLVAIRERLAREIAQMPAELRSLGEQAAPPVEISPALRQLAADVDARDAARSRR